MSHLLLVAGRGAGDVNNKYTNWSSYDVQVAGPSDAACRSSTFLPNRVSARLGTSSLLSARPQLM